MRRTVPRRGWRFAATHRAAARRGTRLSRRKFAPARLQAPSAQPIAADHRVGTEALATSAVKSAATCTATPLQLPLQFRCNFLCNSAATSSAILLRSSAARSSAASAAPACTSARESRCSSHCGVVRRGCCERPSTHPCMTGTGGVCHASQRTAKRQHSNYCENHLRRAQERHEHPRPRAAVWPCGGVRLRDGRLLAGPAARLGRVPHAGPGPARWASSRAGVRGDCRRHPRHRLLQGQCTRGVTV